jgi:hypothetical protein
MVNSGLGSSGSGHGKAQERTFGLRRILDISWVIRKMVCWRTQQNTKMPKLSTFYGRPNINTVLVRVRQWFLSWPRWICSTSLHSPQDFIFFFFSNLHIDFPSSLTPSELSYWGFICIVNFHVCFTHLALFTVLLWVIQSLLEIVNNGTLH